MPKCSFKEFNGQSRTKIISKIKKMKDVELNQFYTSTGGTLKWTLLMIASNYGWNKIVETLIARKAKVNKRTTGGRNALYFALKEQNYNIAQMLINAGSKVNIQLHDKQIMLIDSLLDRPMAKPAIDFLVRNGKIKSLQPLQLAATIGMPSLIEDVINNNGGNIRDELQMRGRGYKYKPLAFAIMHNNIDAANKLIELGALIEEAVTIGETNVTPYALIRDEETISFLRSKEFNFDDHDILIKLYKNDDVSIETFRALTDVFEGEYDNIRIYCRDNVPRKSNEKFDLMAKMIDFEYTIEENGSREQTRQLITLPSSPRVRLSFDSPLDTSW